MQAIAVVQDENNQVLGAYNVELPDDADTAAVVEVVRPLFEQHEEGTGFQPGNVTVMSGSNEIAYVRDTDF